MGHITIEYMILVPVLILQIFLFPFVAQVVMSTWEEHRIRLELEEIAGHFGSSVQQLYYTVQRVNISSGSLTVKLDTPQRIVDSTGNYSYTITIHKTTLSADGEHAQIMNVTVRLEHIRVTDIKDSTDIVVSTLVTLGENADWTDSTYSSTEISAIKATRIADSIWLSFEEAT